MSKTNRNGGYQLDNPKQPSQQRVLTADRIFTGRRGGG